MSRWNMCVKTDQRKILSTDASAIGKRMLVVLTLPPGLCSWSFTS